MNHTFKYPYTRRVRQTSVVMPKLILRTLNTSAALSTLILHKPVPRLRDPGRPTRQRRALRGRDATATMGHSNQNAARVEVHAAQAQEDRKRGWDLGSARAEERARGNGLRGRGRGARLASNGFLVRQRFSRLSQVRPGEEPALPNRLAASSIRARPLRLHSDVQPPPGPAPSDAPPPRRPSGPAP